jgi:3-isopropylmalate dehydrogenase
VSRRTYVVACLAGNGIGPEITAAASRALAQVARQHGFRVDEVHPPFDGEAITRSGHPLPWQTRRATLSADAVLVAGASTPALEGVTAELDLAAAATRSLDDRGVARTVLTPLRDDTRAWTIDRAFAVARAQRGRLAAVAVNEEWRDRVDAHAVAHDGVEVEHVTLAAALERLAGDATLPDAIVAERGLAEALAHAPRLAGRPRLTATGLISEHGPGLFAPTHGAAQDIAGQGVANPSEMLLAAALMLREGLGRPAAAEALEESLAAALAAPVRPPDVAGDAPGATTREFVDVVLALLPSARRDTEFALGVAR